ncbi:hypothetical protein [Paraburkholderia sp. J63]|uniref:hypothetical protein n=1 Tax=Paraburkholderia sp. J63 TaxID=2805434 RepID=UPI002ABE58A0|nr:hypothetical protein [Paraburkholderia sp. J63]
MKAIPAPVSIAGLGNGRLHRAVVALPDAMGEPGRGYQERIVFFEAPHGADAATHLEYLLAAAWCIDTADWCERGFIYNIRDQGELMERPATGTARELQLLEIGWGGGVGPDQAHYARTEEVDLFVTPRVAARLRELLAIVDTLYAAATRAAQG